MSDFVESLVARLAKQFRQTTALPGLVRAFATEALEFRTPSVIGINSTVHPAAKTVYRVSQGPTPWSAQTRLK